MCPPEHFEVVYEINPWMHREVRVDRDRARDEWERLVTTLRDAGAEVVLMDPHPALPDLVFTANAGLVNGTRFVASRFRHRERQPEVPYDINWLEQQGFTVDTLPRDVSFEGAGDALPFGSVVLAGYRFRSDASSHAHVARLTGAAVRSVELADARLYHLDLTFCPLDDRRAIVVPDGWDSYGRKVVAALVPEPLVLELDDALRFCANSVVVDNKVVMPSCPQPVGRQLEAWGFEVAVAPVDEFLKAGGGCRCLTLALDVVL
jgi:N-dimethylarginine dimethylaminohydrolase